MEQKFEGSEGKYIKTGIFMLLFERMHALRGFENVLTDFYLKKEKIDIQHTLPFKSDEEIEKALIFDKLY